MLRWPFHYNNSSMYAAVGDINYIAKSIVPGKCMHLDGERVGLRISDLTIVQYADDLQLVTQWRFRFLTSIYGRWHALLSHHGHEASFMHNMHYHALDIRVLTVAKSAIVEVSSWKRRSREACQRRASMLVHLIKLSGAVLSLWWILPNIELVILPLFSWCQRLLLFHRNRFNVGCQSSGDTLC